MIDEHEAARALERTVHHDVVHFTDAAFVVWNVIERDARRDPGRRADNCLIFASATIVRRVWHYPPGWRQLTAEQLETLSWGRDPGAVI